MKPTKEFFELSNERSITIDHKTETVTIEDNDGRSWTIAFAEVSLFLEVLTRVHRKSGDSTAMRDPSLPQPKQAPTPIPTPTPAPLAPPPSVWETLYLIEKNGFYLRAKPTPGQVMDCDGTLAQARLFQDVTEVGQIAANMGANVVSASEAMQFRIAVMLPNGHIRFWTGNSTPLSEHVNNSYTVTGYDNANKTLELVQILEGQTKMLIPVTQPGA